MCVLSLFLFFLFFLFFFFFLKHFFFELQRRCLGVARRVRILKGLASSMLGLAYGSKESLVRDQVSNSSFWKTITLSVSIPLYTFAHHEGKISTLKLATAHDRRIKATQDPISLAAKDIRERIAVENSASQQKVDKQLFVDPVLLLNALNGARIAQSQVNY